MTGPQFSSVADLNEWMEERSLYGMWNVPRDAEVCKPYLWKWADLSNALMNAAELVPIDSVAMRTLQPKNPSLPLRMSNTLHFSVQVLMPGERTKAHRNLTNETRFVLQAPKGAEFIVDGEAFPMEAGDLVITPSWSWHDHFNGGDSPAIWLDGMDARLVAAAKHINEPFEQPQQPIVRPLGYSERLLGNVRPKASWLKSELRLPPFRYPWAETAASFDMFKGAELAPDPFDGFHLTYSHPKTGGPTVLTYSCEIQLLPARFSGRTHRHNSTTIYHAFRGAGVMDVEGERLAWGAGDIFVVPPWTWHSHENSQQEEAILYSIVDWPTMSSLGYYQEETKSE